MAGTPSRFTHELSFHLRGCAGTLGMGQQALSRQPASRRIIMLVLTIKLTVLALVLAYFLRDVWRLASGYWHRRFGRNSSRFNSKL